MNQSNAILAGFVASVVLTPVVMAIWKRFDPPQLAEPIQLDAESLRSCKAIDREAVIAIVIFFGLVGYAWGFGSTLGTMQATAMISSILAIPYLWVTARCMVLGPQRSREYWSYFQSKHGVGVKLASIVGIISTYVLVISLVMSEFWAG